MSGVKRGAAIVLLILLLLGAGLIVLQFQEYTDITIEDTKEQGDAVASSYADFQGNLLRYTSDGAFYTDYNGSLLWNETYEMSTPTLALCENNALIFDKGGTNLLLLNTAGALHAMQTSMPVSAACVANGGIVAALMQDGGTSYLYLYDAAGNVLASGELHAKNSGYPVSIALSSDGAMLCVSLLDLKGGMVNSTINFYNFGAAGQDAIDNIVATFSYSDMVIPEVTFMRGDKAVAFGDTEFVIFTNGASPQIDEEIFLTDEVKSLFYNKDYFGIVTNSANEAGEVRNRMTVYGASGRQRFVRDIEIPYKSIRLLSNNEILLTDGSRTNLYTMFGVKKLDYTFDGNLYEMIPQPGTRSYVLIRNGGIDRVKLEK